MSDPAVGFCGIVGLLCLIAVRLPIGIALGGVSFAGIWALHGPGPAWGILSTVPYDFAANWSLSSVPLFLFMGYVCFYAGLTGGLFNAARLWLSGLPGGLSIATVFGAAGFSAVSGSSVACAAAMGRIAVPEMLRSRYDPGLATGTVAAAGTIGSMIPPSIILILYGTFAEVPIGKLFIAGILPGLLTVLMYSVAIIARVTVRPELAPQLSRRATLKERVLSLGQCWPVLLLVFGIFGGLFAGIFTPTEAGAVGAFLSTAIGAVKRSINLSRIWAAATEALLTTTAIFVIAMGANLFVRFLALSGTTDVLTATFVGTESNPIGLMMGMSVMYLLLGTFLDPIGAMLLTLPILLPIIEQNNYDLIWFGIVMAKYLEVGLITPPVGMNVFIIKAAVGDDISTGTIFRGVSWFIAADLVTLGFLLLFPEIVLFLPALI